MIDLENNNVSLDFFKNFLKVIKERPNQTLNLIDSVSDNQILSKTKLIELIDEYLPLSKESEVIVFGCWYGLILLPLLHSRFKKITGIDVDDEVIITTKNAFFSDFKNIDFSSKDIFAFEYARLMTTDLIINTSCEHMKPMKDYPYWRKLKPNSYFAFQSTNYEVPIDHINCVYSIEEFKSQLPESFTVIYEHTLKDSRDNRYTLLGKIK